nr:glycosyl hydrolase [Rhodococcus sp. (in: high G+C Gram-positive bacteria)]
MTRFAWLVTSLAAVVIATTASCSAVDDVHHTFGLSAEGENSGVDAAFATGEQLGRAPEVINFFEAWSWQQPLPVDALWEIHNRGAIPAITWEPWHPDQGEYQDAYSPARIAAGEYDAYIAEWADAAARFDQPMQLRFAHEMNGTWYPWSVDGSRATGEQYREAYRHVHDIFLAAGASKVQWVWSFDASSRRPEGLATAQDAYPGDLYVDIVGIDGYNGGAEGSFWQTPEDLFGGALAVADEVAPTRPVWIYETGSGDALGDKAQWITDLFGYLKTTRVSGLLWFDFDKPGEANWLLESPAAALDSASDALAKW